MRANFHGLSRATARAIELALRGGIQFHFELGIATRAGHLGDLFGVQPAAHAEGAAIQFDAGELYRFHLMGAFGACDGSLIHPAGFT